GASPADASSGHATIDDGGDDGGNDVIPADTREVVTERSYRGTLGENTKVEMTLSRAGDHVNGFLHYNSARDNLSLRGRAGADDVFWLDESVTGKRSKKTGSLELHPSPGGGLSGTWLDPSGAKRFPMRLAAWGIAPASRDAFIDFCVRLTRLEKT